MVLSGCNPTISRPSITDGHERQLPNPANSFSRPSAAERCIRGSMTGVRVQPPFVTADHRRVVGQPGQRSRKVVVSCRGLDRPQSQPIDLANYLSHPNTPTPRSWQEMSLHAKIRPVDISSLSIRWLQCGEVLRESFLLTTSITRKQSGILMNITARYLPL